MKYVITIALLSISIGFTNAQNVGIGTTTPTYPLTVIANGQISQAGKGITQKFADVEIGFYTYGSTSILQTWSNHPLQFATNNGSPAMILATNGNFGIGVSQPTNKLHITGIAATANNATIYAINSGSAGNGIFGISNAPNTNGVQGSSTDGTGIYGYSNDFRGVAGSTISGTAIYGNSISGYGLDISGKVKIAGGNTNPSNGAVLTSDASGNAVWMNQKIAFKARGIYSGFSTFPYGGGSGYQKLHFANENYDFGNDFFVLTSSTPAANSSTFVVPVDGLYHFDAHTGVINDPFDYFDQVSMQLVYSRGGAKSTISFQDGANSITNGSGREAATLHISTDVLLLAGDIIWIEVFQSSAEPAFFSSGSTQTQFSGHLVFAN